MITLRTLGTVDLVADSGDADPASVRSRPKALALLVHLALGSREGPVRRDSLLALFWPELSEERARRALSQTLYTLRGALGGDVIVTSGSEDLRIEGDLLSCDACAFLDALDEGRRADAVELYAGDFLPGFHVAGCPELDRWLDERRSALRREAVRAALELAEEAADEGRALDTGRWARWALARVPHDEGALQRGMRLLDQVGNRSGALKAYGAFAQELRRELELEPSPETVALAEELRARETANGGARKPRRPEGSSATAAPTVEAPTHPASQSGESRPRTLRRVALVMIPALVVVTGLLLPGLPTSPEPVPTRVAVFPFDVQGGPDLAYLDEGAMDMVSEALDGLGEVRRVDPAAVLSLLPSEAAMSVAPGLDLARETALDLGAGRYVLGSVTDVGSGIRISARLFDVGRRTNPIARLFGVERSTDPIATATVEGAPQQLVELVQQLVGQLMEDIPVGEGPRLERIPAVQAANYQALKAYLEGEAWMRRGFFDSAGVRLRKAVAADSTFALAWYRLGIAQGWGIGGSPRESIERAARWDHRLTPRDRLLTEAILVWLDGDGVEAEELARKVVSIYPDHREGWHQLFKVRAFHHWQLGIPNAEVQRSLEEALAADPDYPPAVSHATSWAIYQRRFKELEELLSRHPSGGGATMMALANRTALAYASGDSAGQRAVDTEIRTAPEGYRWYSIYKLSWTDSLAAVARLWSEMARDPDASRWAHGIGHVSLAHLAVARGRWAEAENELEQATEVIPWSPAQVGIWWALPFFQRPPEELRELRSRLRSWVPPTVEEVAQFRLQGGHRIPPPLIPWIRDYSLGLLSASLEDSVSALRHASAMEEADEPADPAGLRTDLAREIRALLALRRDRPEDVLEILGERPGPLSNWSGDFRIFLWRRPVGRFLRAEALFRLGRYSEAVGWYDTFDGAGATPEFVFLAPIFLQKARIFASQGRTEEALTHYRWFLTRWKDADPAYRPLLADVRREMERLEGAG